MAHLLLDLWHADPVCLHGMPSHQHLPASAHSLVLLYLPNCSLSETPSLAQGASVLWLNLLVLVSWSWGQTLRGMGELL